MELNLIYRSQNAKSFKCPTHYLQCNTARIPFSKPMWVHNTGCNVRAQCQRQGVTLRRQETEKSNRIRLNTCINFPCNATRTRYLLYVLQR